MGGTQALVFVVFWTFLGDSSYKVQEPLVCDNHDSNIIIIIGRGVGVTVGTVVALVIIVSQLLLLCQAVL